jgi:hypothetical protein
MEGKMRKLIVVLAAFAAMTTAPVAFSADSACKGNSDLPTVSVARSITK